MLNENPPSPTPKSTPQNTNQIESEIDKIDALITKLLTAGKNTEIYKEHFPKLINFIYQQLKNFKIVEQWNKLPDNIKTAIVYSSIVSPNPLLTPILTNLGILAKAGFLEVPNITPEQVKEAQLKPVKLAGKYGKYILPEMEIISILMPIINKAMKIQDNLFFEDARAEMKKIKAKEQNSSPLNKAA